MHMHMHGYLMHAHVPDAASGWYMHMHMQEWARMPHAHLPCMHMTPPLAHAAAGADTDPTLSITSSLP